MKVCLKFVGNLASFLGNELCLDINKCTSIKELINNLIVENDLPLTIEHLAFIDSNGVAVSSDADICNFKDIYVIRVVQGG